MNAPTSASPKSGRPESIDLLCGLVLVLMALEHTFEFFSNATSRQGTPVNLGDGNIAVLLTRWVTLLCAPAFVFLAGTFAFLSSQHGVSKRALSFSLIGRGAGLILLELTWIQWAGWDFAIQLKHYSGLLIWALGSSMILLGALIHLPGLVIAAFGIGTLLLHNTLDSLTPEQLGAADWLWRILHEGGVIHMGWGFTFKASYPLLPWFGLVATGYAFGPVMMKEPISRQHWLLRTGTNLTVLFFLLRFTNLYGDPAPWTSQPNGFRTLLSILNGTNNPPSLCHVLMTFGFFALLLHWLDRRNPHFLRPLIILGRSPIFFYLLHLPVIHGLAVAVNLIRFDRADWLYGIEPAEPPPNAGFDLPYVILAWLIVLLLLYPACHWFSDLKRRRTGKGLRRFL